jgi:hypothetical protein
MLYYFIYDGRARDDLDRATCLQSCSSLNEAKRDLNLFLPFDPVVVSFRESEKYLIDPQIAFDPQSGK